MEEINRESLDQGLENASTEAETNTVVTPEPQESVKEVVPETVSLLGREYNLSSIDQVRELAKDYDRLGRNYTLTTQQLAQLERSFQEKQAVAPEIKPKDPETFSYMSELGFIDESKLNKAIQDTIQKIAEEKKIEEEDRTMENILQNLVVTFDGRDGKPKFNRDKVLEFCIQNGIANPEYGYKLMNYDALKEFDLRQAKSAPSAPPSSGGEGGPRLPQPKKRAIGIPKEDEIALRDAMLETLEHETPTTTA